MGRERIRDWFCLTRHSQSLLDIHGHSNKSSRNLSKDMPSIIISVIALLISLLTSYYSLFDERYDLKMVLSWEQPVLISGNGMQIQVDDQNLTFANSGNRPVSIQQISYIIQPTNKTLETLDEFNCEIKLLVPDAFRRAETTNFQPIIVKPNEIESRTYSFRGHIPKEEVEGFIGQNKHLMSCIFIQFFTPAYGQAIEIIPHTWSPAVKGGGSFFKEVKLFYAVQPIQIIRARWPFSFTPVASR
jgi:hypothetical protein